MSYSPFEYLEHLMVARSGLRILYLPLLLRVMVPNDHTKEVSSEAKTLGFTAIRTIQKQFKDILARSAQMVPPDSPLSTTQFIHTDEISLAYKFTEGIQEYSVLGIQSIVRGSSQTNGLSSSQIQVITNSGAKYDNGSNLGELLLTEFPLSNGLDEDEGESETKVDSTATSTVTSTKGFTAADNSSLPPGTYISGMSLVSQVLHVRAYPPNTSLLHLADKGWIIEGGK